MAPAEDLAPGRRKIRQRQLKGLSSLTGTGRNIFETFYASFARIGLEAKENFDDWRAEQKALKRASGGPATKAGLSKRK